MKIIVFRNNNPFYELSAAANRWLTLIQGILGEGAQVELLIMGGFSSWRECKEYRAGIRPYDVSVFYLSMLPVYKGFVRKAARLLKPLTMPFYCRRAQRYLSEKRPDFVWFCREYPVLEVLEVLEKNRTYRLVYEASEFEDIHEGTGYRQRQIQAERQRCFKEFVLGNVELFTLMTTRLCRHFVESADRPIRYIHVPMTVDLSRFQDLPDEEISVPVLSPPYIAYCGALSSRKDGVDILIRSFAEFAQTHLDYKLCLAGASGRESAFLRELAVNSGVGDRVIFCGMLDRNQIPIFLKNAAIVALARPQSRQAEGGFPTKLGEYLASGRPVCVTRTGEIAEYLTDRVNGFLAEPGSVDDFSRTLTYVADHAEEAEMVGKAGCRVAEMAFNMKRQAKLIREQMETILQEGVSV